MKKIILLLYIISQFNILTAQTITGRLIKQSGNGLPGLQLQLYITPNVYSTSSVSNGKFTFNIITTAKNEELPTGYAISENYPNPFNPKTRINITLPKTGKIRIDIYNLLGQKVKDGGDQYLNAGNNFIDLEFNGLINGYYIAKITIDDRYTVSKKMMLFDDGQHFPVGVQSILLNKSASIVKSIQNISIDSLVVTGSSIVKKVFKNLPTLNGNFLDLGNLTVTEIPTINSLNKSSAAPYDFLTITGSSFDTTAVLSVSFFDNNGFKLNIPVLVARSTSVIVAVPPYINPAGGTFEPGIVNVQVIQNSGGSIVISNTIQNFQIQDLPTTVASAGAVTLYLLNGIIKYDLQLQDSIKGTLLNTSELNAAIANNIVNLQVLVTQIQAVMQSPSTTFTLGSINGNSVVIGTQALMKTDRMIIGMFESLNNTSGFASVIMSNSVAGVKESQQASFPCQKEVIDPCQQEKNDYINNMLAGTLSNDNNLYMGYGGCKSFGLPEAVKTATQVIGGAGTAVMGFFGLGGAPAIALVLPGAALFYEEVMSIVTQIDVAAALKNVNNSESYKAMHQAVDETESMLKDFLLGLVIPETAGAIKDIYTGSSDFIEGFLNTSTLIPSPIAGTYTGTFSGSSTETDCAQWKDDFTITCTITVSGSGTLIDPYSGSIKIEGSVNSTLVYCHCDNTECDPGGLFSFSNTGKVSGSQGNVEGLIEADWCTASFKGGTFNGNTLTGSFTLIYEGQDNPLVKTIILTK